MVRGVADAGDDRGGAARGPDAAAREPAARQRPRHVGREGGVRAGGGVGRGGEGDLWGGGGGGVGAAADVDLSGVVGIAAVSGCWRQCGFVERGGTGALRKNGGDLHAAF